MSVKFGYAVETTKGQKPAAFSWLERCSNISGIELPTENLDASALEDYVTRYIAGRQDTGGEWTVTFNLTQEVVGQLTAMISAYNTGQADTTNGPLNCWYEVR